MPSGLSKLLLAGGLATLPLAGCLYSFAGGGLPGHIRTVAIQPFDNGTTQPLLETDIQRALQSELPRKLGVRLADEATADAIVRGRVVGYDEVAASVRPATGPDIETVPVIQRQIRLTYEAEIYDIQQDEPIWTVSSQAVVGNFQPESESAEIGRARAIEELVTRVIEGAQSQW